MIDSFFDLPIRLYEKYERRISAVALVAGFIFDNLTLLRIDRSIGIVAAFLIAATLCIVFLTMYEGRTLESSWAKRWHFFLMFALQFLFGALFSAFLVFYSRSASLAAAWPFLLLLLGLFIGNEFVKKKYHLLTFRVSVFFVALFSFMILYLPVVLSDMSDNIFLLAGTISLVGIFFFVRGLVSLMKGRSHPGSLRLLWSFVATIFVLFNVFYFSNILPPIPLALKDAAVYHQITPLFGGRYAVVGETHSWQNFFEQYQQLHLVRGDSAYVFSSVFAPTDLHTQIYHTWQYYKEDTHEWMTADRIPLPVIGGSDGGYRGYTFKTNVFPGRWRVNVETFRGQLVGRVQFEVILVETPPLLVSSEK